MNLRKLLCFLFIGFLSLPALASDHDDGETDLKGRALNITDVFAFREDNQTGNGADASNLILIMNTNPRSLPSQQYFFSTKAIYQFNLTQVAKSDKTKKPTGSADVLFRLQFEEPDTNKQQAVKVTFVKNGNQEVVTKTSSGGNIMTTNIANSKQDQLTNNELQVGGQNVTLFAGLREDPFFFDVVQFFKVRAHAIATQSFLGFKGPSEASDFASNYNVNTIVMRVPIALLQSSADQTVFDVWTTILVPKSL